MNPEGTSTAAPSTPEQKEVPSTPASQGGFLRGFARLVIGNAVVVLVVLAALLGGAAWAHSKLVGLRDGLVFIPSHNAELFRDFPAMSDPSHDAFVFWCNGCDLTKEPDFESRFNATIATLDRVSKEEYWCADLEWSSYQSPVHGLPSEVYMSQGNSVSFVEFHFSAKKCMMAVREALKELRTGKGKVLSAQGGPETAAAASMEAEFGTSMKHSMIAMPICAFILWMVVGNVFRATTPMLVVGASFLTGQSAVVASKEMFPSLDVNFDDSMALFVVLALAVDYALFFWTRFNQERDRCQDDASGYREALVVTLHRSSQVIIVSNVFVTMAYGVTMTMPHMNLWAYLALYIECMVGCAAAAFYSVTMIPALAILFPCLFDRGRCPLDAVQQRAWKGLPDPQGMWARWARCITRKPYMYVVPCVVYACMLPFVVLLFQYRASYDVEVSGLRHDILEPKALRQFEDNFNMGMLFPTTLVLEAKFLGNLPREKPSEDAASFIQLSAGNVGGGRPLTWQDLVQVKDVGPREEAADDEKAGYSVRLGATHRSSFKDEKLAQECVAQPGFTSLMSRDRFRMKKDVALSTEFGRAVCQLSAALLQGSKGTSWEVDTEDILSIWWMPNQAQKMIVDSKLQSELLGKGENRTHNAQGQMETGDEYADSIRKELAARDLMSRIPPVLQQSVSIDGNKVLLKVSNRFRPSSPDAYQLDHFIREKLLGEPITFEVQNRKYALSVRHQSCMQVSVDAGTALLRYAPKALAIFAPLVAVAVGSSFGSAFLSVKLALTVIVPILTTYGMAVAVYQMNALNFLGVQMWQGTGGLDYRLIMLTGAILFGFAMDYDLFLFVRVYEHRADGYDNLSAVKKALAETGPVITTAGAMMAVSFFFLMCAQTVFVRIMGFIFFVGVMLDVIVVRMMLAPVFLSLAENLNYWPTKMPKASKTWD